MDTFEIKDVLELHKESCKTSIAAFKRDMQKMRTGRASTSLLEGLMVDYYGTKTSIMQLGQVSSPEARQLLVQIYDANAVESVEKAIQTSDLGFNPSRDGNTLRILVPTLTEETRRDIVKHLHKVAEEYRISIRNHRRDSNDELKKAEKNGLANKDDCKRGLDQIQEQTNTYIAEIDSLLAAKEAECMEV